ncbi:hypothetical protein FA15DRAFT_243299 [Coprinopsis marcescibilis]|uniref:Uncharacterized protein n=1 Tax=Coprinopsis marcescibilis TaxID=230819 RepID=A0A5C3KFJ8_COPMA|nr:hypothetical protein FA15DRAFT_243299 [Coprinopsis marcescibilis]
MPALNEFVPYSTSESIKSYMPEDNQTTETELLKRHYELKSAVSEMQGYLKLHENDVTQELFDLYLLAVVWLLTYDKIIMTLRSYLAQHFFAMNTMTGYIKAISTLNTDYDEMVQHATSAADFLLGKESSEGEDGYVDMIARKRLQQITEIKVVVEERVEDNTQPDIITNPESKEQYRVFMEGIYLTKYGEPSGLREEDYKLFRASFEDDCKPYAIGFADPAKSKLIKEMFVPLARS